MKKISRYLKIIMSRLLKTIMAILMGLGLSLGKNPVLSEKKDNKTIGTNK